MDYIQALHDSFHLKAMVDVCEKAGAILLEGQTELSNVSISSKTSNPNDILTKYDLIVQEYIYKELQQHFPQYPIIGEEEGLGDGVDLKKGYVWFVDPIDGTLNFRMKLKDFSISLGLFKDGKPFAGIVYAPARGEMYIAEKGKGAYLNQVSIHVNSTPLTDIPLYHFELHKIDYQKIIGDIAPFAAHIRRFGGSAALDLALVASGQVDAQFSTSLNLWDIAAGFSILEEAGGTYLSPNGHEIEFSLKPNGYSYIVGHKNFVGDVLTKLPRTSISGIQLGLS